MTIDWGAIALVFGVSLVVTVVITSAFAVATRLLAIGTPDIRVAEGEEADGPNAVTPDRTSPRPAGATAGAILFYLVGAAATVYGIYLVIPLFHPH